jgi:hypothetical protein
LAGFHYVLELSNGEPADPAMFVTALPPAVWKPGDVFIAASDLRKLRIVAIGEMKQRGYEHAQGLWIVEPA